MNEYDRIEREAQRPAVVRDHTAAWQRLDPVLSVNGTIQVRIEAFCAAKRISMDALAALGTRVQAQRNGGVDLAWAFPVFTDGRVAIPAVKFRDIESGE